MEFFEVFCLKSLMVRGKNELRCLSSKLFETEKKKKILIFFVKIISVRWIKVSYFTSLHFTLLQVH